MAENNILIRIKGEADMADAQVQLQDLTARQKELTRQMEESAHTEREFTNLQDKRIKSGKAESQVYSELISKNQARRRAIQEEINATNKSITALKQAISTQAAMTGSGQRMMMQIRQIREELAKMEMAGDTSSQAFIDLSIKAAQLTDQMGDTQRQIQILASDTKNLDAVMGVGTGLAGVFTAATSAAALFGGENEALQKSFLQVQAAMAVLNGVQQVANALNKDSVANVVLRTALNKLFNKEKAKEAAVTTTTTTATIADTGAKVAQTAATTAATTATNKFTVALLKNPVTLVVAAVAALVAGLIYLKQTIDKNEEKQRDFNGELERTQSLMGQIGKDTDYATRIAEAEGKSQENILEIRRQGAKQQLAEADALQRKLENKAKGLYNKLSDEEKKALEDAKNIAKEAWNTLDAINQEGVILEARKRKEAHDQQVEDAKRRNQEIIAAQKELNQLRIAAMQDGLDKDIAEITYEYQERIKAIKGHSKTETQLRLALQDEMQKKLAEASRKRAGETEQTNYTNDSLAVQNALAEAETLYEVRAALLQRQAEIEKAHIEATVTNEIEKANRIRTIDIKLTQDLEANRKSQVQEEIADAKLMAENLIAERENAAIRILNDENSTTAQIKAARQTLADHDKNLREAQEQELKAQYDADLINYQEYQDQKLEIERAALEAEQERLSQQAEMIQEITQEVLSTIGDMAGEIFSAVSDNISRQIEDLDNMYTTDAEEAKKDADKKYITEKELDRKKTELKRKQARLDKAEAALNIALSTAQAIMRIWADVPKADFGASTIALTAIAAALGAAQLAAVLAKPLPQYAKGRSGGKGEYALVGEKGPEVMYIPQGASIIPNSKIADQAAWAQFNVPAMPTVEASLLTFSATNRTGIDYDKLGKTIAENMPRQKAVSVNVDRSGITVSEGNSNTRYHNLKYSGQWT